MSDCSLDTFVKHFVSTMNIPNRELNSSIDAFYAGAHTCYLMMCSAMRDNNIEAIRGIKTELETYKAIKEAKYNVSN